MTSTIFWSFFTLPYLTLATHQCYHLLLYGYPPSQFGRQLWVDPQVIKPASIHVHPQYKNAYSGHDIALIRLQEPAKMLITHAERAVYCQGIDKRRLQKVSIV